MAILIRNDNTYVYCVIQNHTYSVLRLYCRRLNEKTLLVEGACSFLDFVEFASFFRDSVELEGCIYNMYNRWNGEGLDERRRKTRSTRSNHDFNIYYLHIPKAATHAPRQPDSARAAGCRNWLARMRGRRATNDYPHFAAGVLRYSIALSPNPLSAVWDAALQYLLLWGIQGKAFRHVYNPKS